MTDAPRALLLDFLEWLAARPRSYDDVMEAWRTSCPRLPVWEEANERGLVRRVHSTGRGGVVEVTPAAHVLLAAAGRGLARAS